VRRRRWTSGLRPVPSAPKVLLFLAFAFAVMADPVSSVAYAVEAALRALNGHLGLLLPAMCLVIGIIGLVTLNYWQLIRRFREGAARPRPPARLRRGVGVSSHRDAGGRLRPNDRNVIAAAGSAGIAYLPRLRRPQNSARARLGCRSRRPDPAGARWPTDFAVMSCLLTRKLAAARAPTCGPRPRGIKG
jgi:hypothetical protein